MATEPQPIQITSKSNELVWVISNLTVPAGSDPSEYVYREKFRGEWIEVPPNREKKLYMPRTKARRFLGQPVALAEPGPSGRYLDADGNVDPSRFGKPLETIEMSDDELADITGVSREKAEEERKREEEDDKFKCSLCGWQGYSDHGLKVHVSRVHPDQKSLGDSKPEAFNVRKRMPDIGDGE